MGLQSRATDFGLEPWCTSLHKRTDIEYLFRQAVSTISERSHHSLCVKSSAALVRRESQTIPIPASTGSLVC